MLSINSFSFSLSPRVMAVLVMLSVISPAYSDCSATLPGTIETKWDHNCSKNSLLIKTYNSHIWDTRIKICIEQESGNWDCGSEGPVKNGDYASYWACKPTGRYIIESYIYNDDVYSCFIKDLNNKSDYDLGWSIRHAYR